MSAQPQEKKDEFVRLPAEALISISADVYTQPFWDAALEHRLVVPRCTSCATFRFPPSPFCWNCQAQAVEWVERPGLGTVFSFTVVRHPLMASLADTVPYVPAVVELPETGGCRVVGAMIDVAIPDVRIGMEVALVWRDVREGTTVPTWRPATV